MSCTLKPKISPLEKLTKCLLSFENLRVFNNTLFLDSSGKFVQLQICLEYFEFDPQSMLRIYLWLGIIVTFTDFNSIFHPIDSHVNLKVQIPIF